MHDRISLCAYCVRGIRRDWALLWTISPPWNDQFHFFFTLSMNTDRVLLWGVIHFLKAIVRLNIVLPIEQEGLAPSHTVHNWMFFFDWCHLYLNHQRASSCLLKSKSRGVPVNSYNFQINNSTHPMLRANLSPWAGPSMLERRSSIPRRSRSSSTNSNQPNNAYHRLYSIFGDSLVPMIAFNNWQDTSVTKNNLLRIQPLTHAYFPLRPLRRDSTVIQDLITTARENSKTKSQHKEKEPLLHAGRKRSRTEDDSTRHPDSKREKKGKWSSLCLPSRTKLTNLLDVYEQVSTARAKGSGDHMSRKKSGKHSKRKYDKTSEKKTTDAVSSDSPVITGQIRRSFRKTRPVITNTNQYDYHLGVIL